MPLPRYRQLGLLLVIMCLALPGGCTPTVYHGGGGQTSYSGIRLVNPADVWLPKGYKIEAVARGLNYPTGITFDDQGHIYVTESGYSYGEVWDEARLLRIDAPDAVTVIARGGNGPWNGVAFHDGNFYVAEGGESLGGKILKVTLDGEMSTLIDDLPSMGDHHTNGPIIGPDGYLYFGQGTATNSGVVGTDNFKYGWLLRHPRFHDIPGQDVVLAGVNYQTSDPFLPPQELKWYQNLLPFLAPPKKSVLTGAYVPFGTPTPRGEVIKGEVPCTGAIMRISLQGGKPELVAWGLRNPYGLAFAPDGRLFATENQFDVRGSRPVWGTGDLLWEIHSGMWYGWPDYFAGSPINNPDRFGPPGREAPTFLLAHHPNRPPRPAAIFGVHASADGLDFSRSHEFGNVGDAFVAEFGDLTPSTGHVMAPVGFRIARVELQGGIIHPFAVNKGPQDAPASMLKKGGLERPIAARFDPSGKALYVVDFGVVQTTKDGGIYPIENTGVVWKITREGR